VNPDARVTYADIDPVVVAHARALLADAPAAGPPKVTAVEADLRYPRNLITSREIRDHLDLTQPVGLLLVAVLHFLTDRDRPHDAVRCLAGRLAQGSYVVISHGTADHIDSDAARIAAAVYDGASAPGVARSREDIERFLDGLEMVPPGITDAAAWHPGCAPACPSARPTLFYAGIGRVPCSADDDRLRRRSPRMPPVSTPAATTPVTVQTTISLLEALGAELGRSGWKTRLQIASGRAPSLHVQNPAAAQLAETIYAAPKDDGFWFWWSWYEPIAQASADTAAIIVRVLRARPERC
jgi:hypothetical protein